MAAILLAPCHAEPPNAAVVDPREAAELAELAGEGFRIRRSDRFLIAYDTPNETVTPFLGRLEGVHGTIRRFLRSLPFETRDHSGPLRVILFRELNGFRQFAARAGLSSSSAAGFYDPTRDVAVFCDTLALPQVAELQKRIQAQASVERKSGTPGSAADAELMSQRTQLDALVTRFNRLVVQHEATHQSMFHLGLHVKGAMNPAWFVEGLACQFEIPQLDESGTLLKVNQVRLGDFRDALGVRPQERFATREQLAVAIESDRWLSLRQLLTGKERFISPAAGSAFQYAQAWGLVFYLHREHRKQLAAYGRIVASRLPGERIDDEREIREFESAFGPLDDAFEDRWIRYVLAQRWDPTATDR